MPAFLPLRVPPLRSPCFAAPGLFPCLRSVRYLVRPSLPLPASLVSLPALPVWSALSRLRATSQLLTFVPSSRACWSCTCSSSRLSCLGRSLASSTRGLAPALPLRRSLTGAHPPPCLSPSALLTLTPPFARPMSAALRSPLCAAACFSWCRSGCWRISMLLFVAAAFTAVICGIAAHVSPCPCFYQFSALRGCSAPLLSTPVLSLRYLPPARTPCPRCRPFTAVPGGSRPSALPPPAYASCRPAGFAPPPGRCRWHLVAGALRRSLCAIFGDLLGVPHAVVAVLRLRLFAALLSRSRLLASRARLLRASHALSFFWNCTFVWLPGPAAPPVHPPPWSLLVRTCARSFVHGPVPLSPHLHYCGGPVG